MAKQTKAYGTFSMPFETMRLLEEAAELRQVSKSEIVAKSISACLSSTEPLSVRIAKGRKTALANYEAALSQAKSNKLEIVSSCEANFDSTVSLAETNKIEAIANLDLEWSNSMQYSLQQALLAGGYDINFPFESDNYGVYSRDPSLGLKLTNAIAQWACDQNIVLMSVGRYAAGFLSIGKLVIDVLSMHKFKKQPMLALDYIADGKFSMATDLYIEAFEAASGRQWSSLYSSEAPLLRFYATLDIASDTWTLDFNNSLEVLSVYFKDLDDEFQTSYSVMFTAKTLKANVWFD